MHPTSISARHRDPVPEAIPRLFLFVFATITGLALLPPSNLHLTSRAFFDDSSATLSQP
jgi:hypothetical protein